MCSSVHILQKSPLDSANMVAKKEERNKEKKRNGKDDRTLIRSNLIYLNLIFCGPERTEEKWHSQGSYGYIHPPMYVQSLQVTGVVHAYVDQK
jgi:hypothetical protein